HTDLPILSGPSLVFPERASIRTPPFLSAQHTRAFLRNADAQSIVAERNFRFDLLRSTELHHRHQSPAFSMLEGEDPAAYSQKMDLVGGRRDSRLAHAPA